MTEGTNWTDTDLARLRLEGLNHLTRLQSGEATEQDAAEFVAWRMRSRAHEEAFRSAVRLRDLVRTAERSETAGPLRLGAADPPDNVVSLETVARARVSRRGLVGGALAASLAGGVFIVGRSMDLVPSPAELRADYRTETGGRRTVRLAGGASVELNTRTSINLRSDLAMPAVELISGEAIMSSGAAGRAALVAGNGTSIGRDGYFNVRRDGDDVCVTCLGGAVEVRWADEKRTLRSADQVRYNDDGMGEIVKGIDPVVLTAWKSGTLIFRAKPMRAIIDEINRYRPGKVFIANERLASRPLSGTYYVNRLDEFFSQAELGLGAKVMRLPGNVVILT